MKRLRLTLTLILLLTLAAASFAADANQAEQQEPGYSWTVLDPYSMSHTYGRMISRHWLGVQVAVDNADLQQDYILRSITVQASGEPIKIGALGKDVLISAAHEGQIKDRRNAGLRVLSAIGLVAASVSTFAHVGPAYAPVMVAFNGPLIQAYIGLFPDLTVTQVANLASDAFQPNTLVSKGGGRATVTAFVPLDTLMGTKDRAMYFKDPHEIIKGIKVTIRGAYVTSGPTVTSENPKA